jgi:hypothetical protein
MFRIPFSRRIVCDIEELILEVFEIADAVFAESFLPDCALELVADCEGEAALDELRGTFYGIGGREESVKVVGHDYETVEKVAFLIAVSEEDREEKFGV